MITTLLLTAALAAETAPPMLWTVTKDGQTSHLHGNCSPFQELYLAEDIALEDARMVVLAFNPTEVSMFELVDQMTLDEGTLEDQVGRRSATWLYRALRTAHDPSTTARLRPSMAYLGMIAPNPAPTYLWESDKPILTLPDKGFDPQIDKATARLLRKPKKRASLAETGDAMVSACWAHDVETYAELAQSVTAPLEISTEPWFEVLEPELKQGGLFMPLPLMSLVGSGGLIATLKARGYEVTRASKEVGVDAGYEDLDEGRLVDPPVTELPSAWTADGGLLDDACGSPWACGFESVDACRVVVEQDARRCLTAWDLPPSPEVDGRRMFRCATAGHSLDVLAGRTPAEDRCQQLHHKRLFGRPAVR